MYNPLAGQPRPKKSTLPTASGSTPSSSKQAEALSLLDPEIDPSTMAPSTLVLALRKKRREAKREQRSVARRSNLRASTLKTEAEIAEREKQSKTVVHRKGRKALHEGGEARGVRILSQAELIAEALEEEERNKEELQKWLRKEEERKELRRVGRKRVRGPRWTWISRTVGKMVEVIETGGGVETRTVEASQSQAAQQVKPAILSDNSKQAVMDNGKESSTLGPAIPEPINDDTISQAPISTAPNIDPTSKTDAVSSPSPTASQPEEQVSKSSDDAVEPAASTTTTIARPGPDEAGPSSPKPTSVDDTRTTTVNAEGTEITETVDQALAPAPAPVPTSSKESPTPDTAKRPETTPAPTPAPASAIDPKTMLQTTNTPNQPAEPSQYTRNYLILSQIPGGLPAELALVLGSHVAWDEVKYVPARNRPINRRPPICPFTGKVAKYRHPATMIPYADVSGYREIEALLRNRYTWSEGGFWVGGEEDVAAEGVEELEGWNEAVHGGWMAGLPIPQPELEPEPEPEVEVVEEEAEIEEVEVEHEPEVVKEPVKRGRKRASEAAAKPKASKSKKPRK